MYKLYKIIDGIYISDLASAHNLDLIKDNKIKLVIRLSEYDENYNPYDKSVQFINIKLEDWYINKNKLITIYKRIFNIANSFDGNILIHCNYGQNESVSVIIYYLMKQYKYTLEQAFYYVKNIKPDIYINSSFIEELITYNHI